jgi:hypothetical protein
MAKRTNRPKHPVKKAFKENQSTIGFAALGLGAIAGLLVLRSRRSSTGEDSVVDQQSAMTAGGIAAAARMAEPAAKGAAAGGHVPTDLMRDDHPGPEDRAIDAFRPDPTAPIPPEERDALRPAIGAPTLVAGQAPELEHAGTGDGR